MGTDSVNELPGGAVNVDLARGDINVAARVHGHAFAPLLGEEVETLQTPVRAHVGGPGGESGLVGDTALGSSNRRG